MDDTFRCDKKRDIMLLLAILGMLIGTIMGVTGAGGGILGVPALVLALNLSMQQAAPIALIAVVVGAAVGAIQGLGKKLVLFQATLLMAIAALPMTLLGIKVANITPQWILVILFSTIMLIVALRLLSHSNRAIPPRQKQTLLSIDHHTQKIIWRGSTLLFFSVAGLCTGFLTGLLGVGGGFMVVPLLWRYTQISMQMITATSLMFIALVGSSSVINAIINGAKLPLYPTLLFTLTTIIGVFFGRHLNSRLPPYIIERTFACLLVVVALTLLSKLLF